MTKKLICPADLSGVTDDEMHYKGEQFLKGLNELLDEYKSFFGSFEPFMQIEKYCRIMFKQLKAEERIVM